jgi:hypothetical protein
MADDRHALKSRLIELATAADMRFEATPDEERDIKRLAAELQPLNPTPRPAHRADLLDGRWRLLYSSFKLSREATLARLSFQKLPAIAVRVERIFQEVDTPAGHYNNLVYFSRDGLEGAQITRGRFTPAADGTRLDITFHATDVRPTGAAGAAAAFASALGTTPEALAATMETPAMWSDVVYLDDTLRLNVGAYGSLYVLVRDAAPTLSF